MEEDKQRLLHLLKYKIYIVIMSGPFIITESGYWIVGTDVTKFSGWIISKEKRLTTLPRSGWEYWDGTDWVLDDTLLFLPGGPGKEL